MLGGFPDVAQKIFFCLLISYFSSTMLYMYVSSSLPCLFNYSFCSLLVKSQRLHGEKPSIIYFILTPHRHGAIIKLLKIFVDFFLVKNASRKWVCRLNQPHTPDSHSHSSYLRWSSRFWFQRSRRGHDLARIRMRDRQHNDR